ncbi:MAG: Ig-like domain repeat protein, partial [Acidobacteria bacterium]|nr:Ig-like domain repeat protein [Acidobacteriota bacterium]
MAASIRSALGRALGQAVGRRRARATRLALAGLIGALLLTAPILVSLLAVGDTWTTLAPMPAVADGTTPGGNFANGKLYVFSGGNPNAGTVPYGKAYDPATNTWSSATVPPFRGGMSADTVTIGSKLYYTGITYDCATPSPYVHIYDAVAGTWTNPTTIPSPRCSIAAAGLNGKLYLIGGWLNYVGAYTRVDVYDPALNTWSTAAPFPHVIEGATASTVNGKIYVTGGWIRTSSPPYGSYSQELWRYDPPPANTWTQLANMPTPRQSARSAVLNGTMHVLGGESGGVLLNTDEVFDPATGAWTTVAPMTVPRNYPIVGADSQHIYAVGGYSSNATSTVSTTTEMYTPFVATATAVTSSLNPSKFGQSVTFTATVSPVTPAIGTPSGTVIFKDGVTTLGTATLSGGTATYTTSALVAAGHSMTAVYSGDTSFTTSTSPALMQVVNRADTTTTVTSGPSPSAYGQSVTFTATVGVIAPGAGTPTGSVQFKDNGTPIGSAATLSGGSASFSTTQLTVGTHTITADYNAGPDFNASSSGGVTQTVNKANTTTAVAVSGSVSGTWQSKAAMPTPRHGAATGVVNGVAYVTGGYNAGHLATVQAYDPAANAWTMKPNRPGVQTSAASAVIGGTLYVAGGTDCCVEINTVYAYTPATNTWTA